MANCGSSHEDDAETVCPLCVGDIPDHIVGRIMEAAAGPMSGPMTLEEFKAWLAVFPSPPM